MPSSFRAKICSRKALRALGQGDLAQRLNADAQRTHRPGHQRIEALGRLAGQARALTVDVGQLVHTSVLGQTKRIGAEGVCFNDLGPGVQVFLMDAADEIGLRDIQLVVAAVDEDTLGVQQGAHGAVA